ncbi:MAG: caspase family protein [Pseudomonadota bacterium]|nr:caspase family protein [Pseudomonadota bacterium]
MRIGVRTGLTSAAAGLALATAALGTVALGSGGASAQDPEPKRIALVIGLSSYARLPAELGIDTARNDAARVAAALEQSAGFDQVRLLTDASATLDNVQSVLREQVSKEVTYRDLFLFYFVGHGVGGDYGEPRLLFYDTDPDALETTSLTAMDLGAQLQKWVPASRYMVITDAAHEGTLNGLALLGPTGNDWPVIGQKSFILSSAAPRQAVRPGIFAKSFIEGMSGDADSNGDGVVTGSELNGFLVVSVPNATNGAQLPTVQGKYDPNLELARKRVAPVATTGTAVVAAPVAPAPVSDIRVDKAKFVFNGGGSPKVQCVQAPVTACDPSCYVWDVPAGPCKVSMTVEGRELTGDVEVLYRGAYSCGVYRDTVQCSSPPPP